MFGKYLNAIVIALLIVVWGLSAAYGYVRLGTAVKLADSVGRGTVTFQQELEQARVDLVAQRGFPDNAVLNALKASWAESINVSAYPQDILFSLPAPSARPRGR